MKENGKQLPEQETEQEALTGNSEGAEPDKGVAADRSVEVESEEEAAPEETEPSVEEQLQEAEAKAAEYLEGWQRARAEFANARKRLERERGEARRNATVEVIRKLLPIIDDFDRALENVPEEISTDSWFEGVALVYRKLTSTLEGVNIERIEAVGQPFDPNFHEAVMQEESDEYESGVVIKELQPGYKLDERVIRPAMVIVAA